MLKRCIYNFPLFIVFVLLCVLTVFISGRSDNGRIWDGYYIVGIPEKDIEEILERGVFQSSKIITAENTTFKFNDFGTMEEVALKDIPSRFVEGDPRVDEYMLGAGRYFHASAEDGSSLQLIYVESKLSPLNFFLRTRHRAGDISKQWYFPDFTLKTGLYSSGLFALAWFFGIWFCRGQRFIAAAAGLPWLISVIVNGSAFLPASVSLFIFLLLLEREIAPDLLFYLNYGEIRFGKNLWFYSAAFILSLTAHLYLNISTALPVLPIFISITADILCFFIYYSLKSQRVRMQEHRLFFPVRISISSINEVSAKKLPETAAAATAVLIIPLFVLFFQSNSPIEIPVPQSSAAFSGWSWESLDYIDKTYDGLVNASDFVTHKAFQEGFMYGRKWSFPLPDEKITTGQYVVVNNEIEYRENCIEQFTEDWYTSIIKPETNTGLTALLLGQKTPGGIILKSDISETMSGFKPVRHVFISLMAILPIFGLFMSGISITVRRKGQEA